MSKTPRRSSVKPKNTRQLKTSKRPQFDAVLSLIAAARTKAVVAVNATLIDLYWSIGRYISDKVQAEAWGDGTMEALAAAIQSRYPGVSGYWPSNL